MMHLILPVDDDRGVRSSIGGMLKRSTRLIGPGR